MTERTWSRAQTALFLAGAALLLCGGWLAVPWLIASGIAGIGLASAVAGLEAIALRRASLRTRQGGPGPLEVYTGAAARLLGVWYLALGALFFLPALSLALFPAGIEGFWAWLLGGPVGWGILALAVGGMVFLRGVIRLLAGTAGVSYGVPARAGAALARIEGVLKLLLGSSLVLLGLLALLAPGLLGALGRQLVRAVFR